jgi:hypothetical protein
MDAFVGFVKKIGIPTMDQCQMLVMEKSFLKSNASKDQTSFQSFLHKWMHVYSILSLETVI